MRQMTLSALETSVSRGQTHLRVAGAAGWRRSPRWTQTSMRYAASKGGWSIMAAPEPSSPRKDSRGASLTLSSNSSHSFNPPLMNASLHKTTQPVIRCSDLLELRPDFNDSASSHSACDPRWGRNRGSVLSMHLAWPPPKPPPSALLQPALRFTTDDKRHRMNWVSS